LHNKNQKVFISQKKKYKKKAKQKRFSTIACVTNRNTKKTAPAKRRQGDLFFVCSLAMANPDGRNFSEFARVEGDERTGQRMFRRLLWRIPFGIARFFVFVDENCFVSSSESERGFEP
jgi:hypothetical protein